MALRDRLRPWHALMLAVFVAGTIVSLLRADALTVATGFRAVLSGLLGLVVFQFTVGNIWGYAVEYRNAGGRWSDWPFLAPFIVAGVAGVAIGVYTGSVGAGAWAAFWVFVVVAALVAIGTWLVVGYRTGASANQ
ncbi:hypothetical protein [Haloplanus halobius]|uniref:hypothetical protein n=1 Tax=Haloplanus halobius TaxID=2934938 RepID=UPI00200D84FA|nr:hypothetical protein [Haloplanus sp. XH21]